MFCCSFSVVETKHQFTHSLSWERIPFHSVLEISHLSAMTAYEYIFHNVVYFFLIIRSSVIFLVDLNQQTGPFLRLIYNIFLYFFEQTVLVKYAYRSSSTYPFVGCFYRNYNISDAAYHLNSDSFKCLTQCIFVSSETVFSENVTFCDLVYFNQSTLFVFCVLFICWGTIGLNIHHCAWLDCVYGIYIYIFVIFFTISLIFLYSPSTLSVESWIFWQQVSLYRDLWPKLVGSCACWISFQKEFTIAKVNKLLNVSLVRSKAKYLRKQKTLGLFSRTNYLLTSNYHATKQGFCIIQ